MKNYPIFIANELKVTDKIAIIKTDTLYGLVASAHRPIAINKIYNIKKRQPHKPLIILIGEISQLDIFGVDDKYKHKALKYWPGPYSLIMPISDKYSYLSSHGKAAFRLPNKPLLCEFIINSGPLVAPSANPEGLIPAKNIKQAKNYFGDNVNYYIDHGTCHNLAPSTLIDLTNDKQLR